MTDLTLTPEQRAEAIEALAGVFLAHGVAVDFDGEAYIERPNLVAERALDALLPLLSGWRPEPVAGVRVKPLVWERYEGDQHCFGGWMAPGMGGDYTIEDCTTDDFYDLYFPKAVEGVRCGSHDEAVGKAQEHFDAIILSALEPVALPNARAAAEARKGDSRGEFKVIE